MIDIIKEIGFGHYGIEPSDLEEVLKEFDLFKGRFAIQEDHKPEEKESPNIWQREMDLWELEVQKEREGYERD